MTGEGVSVNTNISLGDVLTLLTLVGVIIYNYYAIVRRIDRITERVKHNEDSIEDMRRGRGLILETWPIAMQRLMGFRNGGGYLNDRPHHRRRK